jgi:hypothetical protein
MATTFAFHIHVPIAKRPLTYSIGAVVVIIVWSLDLQLPMQSVHITTNSGEVYSIQHYVIQFVSTLRQVGGFLWVLRFPPPIKLNATI